jgi:hypothetical protein
VFKLAAVALPINTNPYNHKPPMQQEHGQCIRDNIAGSSIYFKISMGLREYKPRSIHLRETSGGILSL